MREDRKGLAPVLFPADPLARQFPTEWRDLCFRRCAVAGEDGIKRYKCPRCKRLFDHSDIDFLQGDHVWHYSLCGETSWENYQMICGSCNASKRDFIDQEIRRVLGAGEFRKIVASYLRRLVDSGELKVGCGFEDLLQDA